MLKCAHYLKLMTFITLDKIIMSCSMQTKAAKNLTFKLLQLNYLWYSCMLKNKYVQKFKLDMNFKKASVITS